MWIERGETRRIFKEAEGSPSLGSRIRFIFFFDVILKIFFHFSKSLAEVMRLAHAVNGSQIGKIVCFYSLWKFTGGKINFFLQFQNVHKYRCGYVPSMNRVISVIKHLRFDRKEEFRFTCDLSIYRYFYRISNLIRYKNIFFFMYFG